MKAFTSKFIDVVTEYFADRVEKYIADNGTVVDKVVKECQETLNVSIATTDDLFKNLARELMNGENVDVQKEKPNWLQIMMSAYLGDYSAALKGGMDGKAPWMDYLKRTIFNTVWQVVLISFIDGGLGFLVAIAIEFLQGRNNKTESVKKVLENSKNAIVKAIREKTEETKDALNKKVASEISIRKEEQCAHAACKLADEQNNMRNIEEFYARHNTNLEAERMRFERILDGIYQEAANAYSVVFNKQLTLQQFKQF